MAEGEPPGPPPLALAEQVSSLEAQLAEMALLRRADQESAQGLRDLLAVAASEVAESRKACHAALSAAALSRATADEAGRLLAVGDAERQWVQVASGGQVDELKRQLAELRGQMEALLRQQAVLGGSVVQIAADGTVRPPVSGAYDAVVAVGEDVQAAIDGCKEGGALLLSPGLHDLKGPVAISREVHVFGEGATLQCALPAGGAGVVASKAGRASLVGVAVRQLTAAPGGEMNVDRGCCVRVLAGSLRLQGCDVTSAEGAGAVIGGVGDAAATPVIKDCRIHGCRGGWGILVRGTSAYVRVEGCEVGRNKWAIQLDQGAAATVLDSKCALREVRSMLFPIEAAFDRDCHTCVNLPC